MAASSERKIKTRRSEIAARIRENFAIWRCPVIKPSKTKSVDTDIPTDDINDEKNDEEEDDEESAILEMIEKLSKDISPSQSSDDTARDKAVLPLSTANLLKATEDEEQRLLSGLTKSYSLTEMEIREALQTKRMKKWIARANPEGRLEDTASASFRSGNPRIDRSTRISLKDILQQHTDDTSSNPYLSDRNERVDAAKERITVLQSQTDGIQPEVFISLRHAMSIDAEGLAGIYNSYVRSSGYTLDTKLIAADKVCKYIDESRQQELPFIVAIKQDPDKEFENRHPWGLILGFVRLCKFLTGDAAVVNAAQLEIMVSRTAQGRSVGRCLMDAMMTIADPHYSPRGGYTFHSDVPNDTMINCASWSCRPLSRIVILMSYITQEADRCQRVKRWLVKEHGFCEQGYLPSIGQKMCQSLSVSILVREV